MNKRYSAPSKFLVLSALMALLLGSGCFLDFDEFDTLEGPGDGEIIGDGEGDGVTGGDGETDGETGGDGETDGETGGDGEGDVDPGEPGGFGSTCTSNDDCFSDICLGNVCLQECVDDRDCHEMAGCFQIGHQNLCAPRCLDTGSCDYIDYRDDLSCVNLVQTRTLSRPAFSLANACLPDQDQDGVFDGIDNCPDTPNPTQSDRSADGVGDACSPTPLCHVDSSEGLLDFDSVAFRPGNFSIPTTVSGRWLPIVGTTDSTGTPESTLLLLDRHSGEWTHHGPLGFAGEGRQVLFGNDESIWVSPGTRSSIYPTGTWIRISTDKEITFEHDFSSYINNNRALGPIFRFNSGQFVHSHVSGPTSLGSPPSLTTGRYDSLTPFSLQAVQFLTSEISYDVIARQLHHIEHLDGTHSLGHWSPTPRSLALATLRFHVVQNQGVNITSASSNLFIPAEWTYPVEEDGDNGDPDEPGPEPLVEDLSDFDPILLPATGGQLYVFDRNTGRAGRFISTLSEANLDFPSWGAFERTPEYDLTELEDFLSFQVYLLPAATGLGIVGRLLDAPDELVVREIYFACHPRTAERDSTGDGIPDLLDNCPLEENPDQEDLDGDGRGDLCDPDIDGDGIPNSDDFTTFDTGEIDAETGEPIIEFIDLSRDSRNNGIPNESDLDIDGDRIPTDRDPFPLDSVNDGLPNSWTTDTNANGFPDSQLRSIGVEPYSPFGFLTAQKFYYLVEDPDGERTIYASSLRDPNNATALDLPAGINPHNLRFGTSPNLLVFLGGPPGETDTFYVYDIESQEVVVNQSVFATLRSVSMLADDTFLAVHEVDNTATWRVSRVTIDPNFSRSLEFDGFPHIWDAHLQGDFLTILAADFDCRDCAVLYRYSQNSGQYSTIGSNPAGTVGAFFAWGPQMAVAYRDEGTPHSFLNASSLGGFTYNDPMPESFQTVHSIGLTRQFDGSLNPADHALALLMVTASRWGQPSGIWVFNPRRSTNYDRWSLLLALDNPIVEAIWEP